jgi:hypothetical protein
MIDYNRALDEQRLVALHMYNRPIGSSALLVLELTCPLQCRRSRLSSDMSILRRRATKQRVGARLPHTVSPSRIISALAMQVEGPLFAPQPSSNGRCAQAVRKSVEDGGQESQYGAIIACWHCHVKARAASFIRCMGPEAEHTANHDF